jgi:hypothetical protein
MRKYQEKGDLIWTEFRCLAEEKESQQTHMFPPGMEFPR